MVKILVCRLLMTMSLIIAIAAPAAAQQASITGTVADSTDLPLPGVTVVVTNGDTGVPMTVVSDARGEYRVQRLSPGRYTIRAELSGFNTVVLEGIELLVGQSATIPVRLDVAQLNETLVVTGEAPLVDTTSSQVSGNVDRRQMEDLPLQGRNWIELSKMVKGITANTITNTPGVADDHFQLNLDGQQITQKVAGSGFGQPRFSREAIAEFQIVTNLFDITQGRSLGTQVQAVSRAGTNTPAGSFYGNFRHDGLNAADPLSGTVLPYENRQIGGTFGGPIVRDRMHYFVSYEDEREPGSIFRTLSALPGQSFETSYEIGQSSFLGRVDSQLTNNDRLSIRASRWDWSNPQVGGNHPSTASAQTKDATSILATWTHVLGSGAMQEIRVGYNDFTWENRPQPGLETVEYRFPGLTVGGPYNFPQILGQDNLEARYDFNLHKGRHDIKLGAEVMWINNSGIWNIQQRGIMFFTSVPGDLTARIPQDAAMDPARWDFSGLEALAQRFDQNFHAGDWSIEVPRPTWALWFGDNWRMTDSLTLNYGVRWDVDLGATDPPDVIESTIPIDNGLYSGDFGFKRGTRDLKNVAPRVGFAWNVGGTSQLVIRGGSGLYFATPVSNVTFSPQIYSQMVTATFPNDGLPGFVDDPTRGVTTYEQALAAAPAQSPRIISPDFRNPYTWQSSLGFQVQLAEGLGFEADVTHYEGRREARTIDPNLFYDPVTGYNLNPALGRPHPDYGVISTFVSNGRSNQTMLSMGLNRRFRNRFQAGATYALMLQMHDDGGISYGSSNGNNTFDRAGEWATSTEFQRHTVRGWVMFQPGWGMTTSVSYSFGSGNRYAATIATQPFGKTGANRLNLTASGEPTNAIVIPEAVLDRWHGPAIIESGQIIPRNALAGMPVHQLDVRVQKSIGLAGSFKVDLIGEVFNVFNHANYSTYATSLSATSAATLAQFGRPTAASSSRQGQLAFRVSF